MVCLITYLFFFIAGPILKTVTEGSGAYSSQEPNNSSSPSDSVLITQYKDLIRDQDIQIQKLKSTVEILHREKQALQVVFCYSMLNISQIKFCLK